MSSVRFTKQNSTVWFSSAFPRLAEMDLGKGCRVQRLSLESGDAKGRMFRFYGSRDGQNFFRLQAESRQTDGQALFIFKDDQTVRCLRAQIVDDERPEEDIAAIALDVLETGEALPLAADPLSNLADWRDTAYARPVTAKDTEHYLSGLVERVLGERYVSWFAFRLENGHPDAYRVEAIPGGSILITGGSGVAMAAGLNRYLKDCCRVHVAEQEKQTRMPKSAPLPKEPLLGKARDAVRYANNYCTLSYTMPFWDEADWQRELDWLALCGVNTMLDFTGMEAVWYLFLRSLGCADGEIDQFLVGPCYTAWHLMQNIQGFGGPLNRRFIADRVELARKNQYKMRLLGISPVRQAYAGMLPDAVQAHREGLRLFPQGTWCGIARPSMLDPTLPAFGEIAALFYQCQERVLGGFSRYYAIDPYHEGGNRPKELTDGVAAQRILGALLSHDPQGVWMVQAWRDNPSRGLLEGLSAQDRRRHLMILDLSATDHPLHGDGEFYGTPWIYCMLDMYGGRVSTHGDLDALAHGLPETRRQCAHMVGSGTAAEASCHNPVAFDLLFDMAWREESVDLDAWMNDYIRRRYGFVTQNALDAWRGLLATAYRDPGYSHHGGYTQMFTYRPRLSMHVGPIFNELNSEIIKAPYYEPRAFYKAVESLARAYPDYRNEPCFLYDLQDALRQTLNLLGSESALRCLRFYQEKDVSGLEAEKEAFLSLASMCDRVMRARRDTLLSSWSGKAAARGRQYDDFSEDVFALNARALITTWGYRATYGELADYAYRQLGGLLAGHYRERWGMWLSRLLDALRAGREAEDITLEEWFRNDWAHVLIGLDAESDTAPLPPEEVFPQAMKLIQREAARLWG